ncbi:hypothetical protein HDU89_000359 [Geranomyces variabilis]|nr:hypothetical protein HDU89_000359 [Geranomyces variabilis]
MGSTTWPPPDTRADANLKHIHYRKNYDARMQKEFPGCFNTDKPWRRYPGCSRGCRLERHIERDEKRWLRRRELKKETRHGSDLSLSIRVPGLTRQQPPHPPAAPAEKSDTKHIHNGKNPEGIIDRSLAAPPAIRAANNTYAKNIHKRGFVKPTLKEKPSKYPVGPILLGFFVFVVLGSSIFEIFSRKL